MLLPILCLTELGCTETPAEKAVTGNHPTAHIGRGGPRNGLDFVVYPDVLAKWIREIPEIAKGTPADEVIKRLGEPDLDYLEFAPIFGPYRNRTLVYNIAMDRIDKYEPMSSSSVLVDVESIDLIFDLENRYETYRLENPLHPFKLNSPPDHDLTSLILEGPAASTSPTVSQPSP